jgi:tetratricopeptide (TPR) repeat protein
VGALGACGGGRRPAAEESAPAELLVEVLPPDAQVVLDGRPLGPGSRAVPAPGPRPEPHLLRVEADGYEPVERQLAEDDLAGVRVGAALRPLGLGSERLLELDEPVGLAQAAAHLAPERPHDAVAYAERALALDGRIAVAHRALGDARAALGDPRRAAAAWAEYLRLAPEAPDAAAVAERIAEARPDAAPRAR